jgi:hypothetical protein
MSGDAVDCDSRNALAAYDDLDEFVTRSRWTARRANERGPHARDELLRLLDDERIEVRGWVAAHALEFAPERAARALEDVASGPPSLEEFSAKMVLQVWRNAGQGQS